VQMTAHRDHLLDSMTDAEKPGRRPTARRRGR
jgi:hypothetical protein